MTYTTKFFEWNGTDLSQFSAKVEGPTVVSSDVQVVDEYGVSWIEISATFGATPGDYAKSAIYLPINITPPSNSFFVCDVASVSSNSRYPMGGLASRFTAVNHAYVLIWRDYGYVRPYFMAGTESVPTATVLGADAAFAGEIQLGNKHLSVRLGIGAEGTTDNWIRVLCGCGGSVNHSTYTTGTYALYVSSGTYTNVTRIFRFRRIVGYTET